MKVTIKKNSKIKNKKLVNQLIGEIVNVGWGEDGVADLNEFMKGMYGREWDGRVGRVEKLKEDVLEEYGIKIGVDCEREEVYIWSAQDEG